MFLDQGDTLGLAAGGYESAEVRCVRGQVRPGDTAVDIGANLGYYTLLLAELVGDRGRVIAFEPDAENYRLLEANVALNGYSNVHLERLAVSDRAGPARLHRCPSNCGMHRLYESVCCSDWLDVESVTLDAYLDGEAVDFIKMDIEGCEHAALSGMGRVLSQDAPPRLLTEFSPVALFEYGLDPRDYVHALLQKGFALYDVATGSPVDTDHLLRQLARLNEALHRVASEDDVPMDLDGVMAIVSRRLHEYGYERPILENFLCIRDPA